MNKSVALLLLSALGSLATAQQDYVIFSGGVGQEERDSAPAQGTRLIFMGDAGHFVANVRVTVTDSSGKRLVDTTCPGPWLILDLPPGSYDLRAELAGKRTGGRLTVGTGPQKVAYRFAGL